MRTAISNRKPTVKRFRFKTFDHILFRYTTVATISSSAPIASGNSVDRNLNRPNDDVTRKLHNDNKRSLRFRFDDDPQKKESILYHQADESDGYEVLDRHRQNRKAYHLDIEGQIKDLSAGNCQNLRLNASPVVVNSEDEDIILRLDQNTV